MISITPRQRELLDYLRGHAVLPGYRQIARDLGLGPKSQGEIVRRLKRLEERGVVKRHTTNGYTTRIDLLDQPIVIAIRGEFYRFIPKERAA